MDFCVCIISDLLLIQHLFIYCCLWVGSRGWKRLKEELRKNSGKSHLKCPSTITNPYSILNELDEGGLRAIKIIIQMQINKWLITIENDCKNTIIMHSCKHDTFVIVKRTC